jgi:hypothetical protein
MSLDIAHGSVAAVGGTTVAAPRMPAGAVASAASVLNIFLSSLVDTASVIACVVNSTMLSAITISDVNALMTASLRGTNFGPGRIVGARTGMDCPSATQMPASFGSYCLPGMVIDPRPVRSTLRPFIISEAAALNAVIFWMTCE